MHSTSTISHKSPEYGEYFVDTTVDEDNNIINRTFRGNFILTADTQAYFTIAILLEHNVDVLILPDDLIHIPGDFIHMEEPDPTYRLKVLHIPDSVTHIHSCAFCNSQLSEIVGGKNVTFIEYKAFSGTILRTISNFENLYYVGMHAFENASIAIIETPSIRILDHAAFYGCPLQCVTLPNLLTLQDLALYAGENAMIYKIILNFKPITMDDHKIAETHSYIQEDILEYYTENNKPYECSKHALSKNTFNDIDIVPSVDTLIVLAELPDDTIKTFKLNSINFMYTTNYPGVHYLNPQRLYLPSTYLPDSKNFLRTFKLCQNRMKIYPPETMKSWLCRLLNRQDKPFITIKLPEEICEMIINYITTIDSKVVVRAHDIKYLKS